MLLPLASGSFLPWWYQAICHWDYVQHLWFYHNSKIAAILCLYSNGHSSLWNFPKRAVVEVLQSQLRLIKKLNMENSSFFPIKIARRKFWYVSKINQGLMTDDFTWTHHVFFIICFHIKYVSKSSCSFYQKLWQDRWSSLTYARQTKIWFPNFNKKASHELLRLKRLDLGQSHEAIVNQNSNDTRRLRLEDVLDSQVVFPL